MCPVTGARPAEKRLGVKKVERKRPRVRAREVILEEEEQRCKGGQRRLEGKREELCKRGG